MRRLVLGCGTVGNDIVESLTDRTGDLHVITDDSGRVSALRDEHVAALEADPRDPDNYPDHADLVVVADAGGAILRDGPGVDIAKQNDALVLHPGGEGQPGLIGRVLERFVY